MWPGQTRTNKLCKRHPLPDYLPREIVEHKLPDSKLILSNVLTSYQINSMPIPERIWLTHAGVNDVKAYELLCHDPKVKQYINFGDRAYPESQHIHTY